jgi:HEAT repeat protein
MVREQQAWRAAAVGAFLLTLIFTGHHAMATEPTPAAGAVADQVAKAFAAVRSGDLSQVSSLEKLGPNLVPALATYMADADENVRREAVSLLSVVGGEAAVPLLARAVSDSSAEVAERASLALYERFDPDQVAANAEAAKAVLGSIAAGQPTAATLVLAGYLPGEATQQALREFLDRPASNYETRLFAGSSPISARLPAQLALARLGGKEAMRSVAELTERAPVAEWQFLLAAIRDINAPRLLHAVKRALDDPRETSAGIPSHAGPKRRVCDEAANALVNRLKLKTSFALSTTLRYSPEQLAEVRRLIDEMLPK